MAHLFDIQLLQEVLKHLPLPDILKTCSSLPAQQTICRNSQLWKYLLYRDYRTFAPIIEKSQVPYFDLYRQFYSSKFYNSPDFTKLYSILLKYTPLPLFFDYDGNSTIIPIVNYLDPNDFDRPHPHERISFKQNFPYLIYQARYYIECESYPGLLNDLIQEFSPRMIYLYNIYANGIETLMLMIQSKDEIKF